VGDPHRELLHTLPTSLMQPAPQVLLQQEGLVAQIIVTHGSQPEVSLAPVMQRSCAQAAAPLEVDDEEELEVVELALVELEVEPELVDEALVDALVLVEPALVADEVDDVLDVLPADVDEVEEAPLAFDPLDPLSSPELDEELPSSGDPPLPPRDPSRPESRVVPWAQAAARQAPKTSDTKMREAKAMGNPRS
jgi:hypothetical protein